MPGKVSEAFPPIESKASHRNFRCGAFFLFPPAACGRDWGGRLIFREETTVVGAGGPGALQTSSNGRGRYRDGNFRLLLCVVGWGGGRLIFCEKMLLVGAGGPGALQTSSPARRPSRAASFSARGPAGLTCRASPANSSIAGAAPLDSVRLRRNRSLLLCETQSSSLTCARGADRACTREKTEVLLQFKAVLSHALAALTALNKCASQAGREALAAQDAYPVRKQTITEKLSVLTVPAQSKRPECAQFSGRYRFFKCLLSKCAQFSGRYRSQMATLHCPLVSECFHHVSLETSSRGGGDAQGNSCSRR